MKFGNARLYREDIGFLQKMHYKLFGLADPGHYLRSRYFKKYSKNLMPRRVLDAGCGGGDYSFYMAQFWPEAIIRSIDNDRYAIERNQIVKKKMSADTINFEQMDLTKLDVVNAYDLIVCIDVLEHIRDQQLVLSRFCKALKSGGHLFIHIPLKRDSAVPLKRYLADFDEWAEHAHIGEERTKEEMLSMLKEAGYEIVKSEYTFRYYCGEMANSIYSAFYKKTNFSIIMQGILSPIAKLLALAEGVKSRNKGFALAVLAIKR